MKEHLTKLCIIVYNYTHKGNDNFQAFSQDFLTLFNVTVKLKTKKPFVLEVKLIFNLR